MSAVLEFRGIGKNFPGVRALSDVSLAVHAGTVHGLMGENGAGKSTLLKILGGVYQPDAGQVLLDGRPQRLQHARAAIDAGISIIHQELQYVPELSVMENLMLGHLPQRLGFVRARQLQDGVREQLQKIGVDLDPLAKLKHLSIAQRQMVEICKALLRNAKVIAFDEPTSSLSHREADVLFALVASLRSQGKAMIYISHRMDEIFQLCDACTIFRDGRKVGEHVRMQELSRETLIGEMVGREVGDIFNYRSRAPGQERLRVTGIVGRKLSAPASFAVRSGEILGFFGLVGSGRSELMRLVYGADRSQGGQLEIDGQALPTCTIPESIRRGIMFCPEDRKEQGILGCRSVSENINVSCRRNHRRWRVFVDDRVESRIADDFIGRLRIKTPHRNQAIRLLSGGNQQKTILARCLAETGLKVLIVDEPTRGIDVGAKNEIYAVLYELAERGVAIVMISSELPEVIGVSDRLIVMCQGRISGELTRAEATEAKVLHLALPSGAGAG
ncbi:L-arabinose ABC transporter ATP-binding protein AraG [Verminephrobacter aporrectodeae]|uniref:L-arabinose ABC transporter ATP-binding protein AraG n=1 Tax=Verminephrobacter aporrectodeae TaxID=1110389 RepID=UPI000237617D|nr:L-arabinose ABC transporter ATP-binding protein AraG [Verminephrobacter aporrectodeae]